MRAMSFLPVGPPAAMLLGVGLAALLTGAPVIGGVAVGAGVLATVPRWPRPRRRRR